MLLNGRPETAAGRVTREPCRVRFGLSPEVRPDELAVRSFRELVRHAPTGTATRLLPVATTPPPILIPVRQPRVARQAPLAGDELLPGGAAGLARRRYDAIPADGGTEEIGWALPARRPLRAGRMTDNPDGQGAGGMGWRPTRSRAGSGVRSPRAGRGGPPGRPLALCGRAVLDRQEGLSGSRRTGCGGLERRESG